MKSSIVLIVLLKFVVITVGKDMRSWKTLYFLAAETQYDTLYITHYTVNVSRDHKALNIFTGMTRQFPKEPWSLITINFDKPKADRGREFMLQYDINICRDLITQMNKHIRGFIGSWLRKYMMTSNFPLECPIQQGNYSWTNFNLSNLTLPAFLPNSKYAIKVIICFYNKGRKEFVANLDLLIEIK